MKREIKVPTNDHSVLGPSGAKRWLNCPGSVNASKDAKDDESIYAASGSATHYLSELARNENKFTYEWLGDTFISGKYRFVVDDDMANSAQEFVNWCRLPGEKLVEQRIDFSAYMDPAVVEAYGATFGTLDDANLNDDIVTVTDFKDGQGVQEFAEKNPQLLLQALGLYDAFSYLYKIKGFNLRICQPRLNHFDEWYISTEDLLKWANEVLPVAGRLVLEGTRFRAGAWCKFCRIRKTCAVRANQAAQTMLDEGEFEDLDQIETHALRATNRGQMVTNEQLGKILNGLDLFKAWIKDMERRAITALIAGEKVGDWKLVNGRAGRRKFIDEKTAAEKLQSLEVDPYKPRELISVSEAEKTLGKTEFKRRFKEDEDFTKPAGKPKLAPAADKRPAITNMSVDDFENLDEADE